MTWYPLLFNPIFQERIWGGRNLDRLYTKHLPPNRRIGESWEISDRPEAQSVVRNGSFAGRSLSWLMQHHERALLGQARALNGRFPLLVKILDAEEKLSLQVHPPAHKAAALGGEPKTELWYIAEARPGAELFVGLRPGVTRESFAARVQDGSVAECFHRIPVHTGDAMFLPSGRVHAIGAGLVIFEIQQNSDTTYRVFDWHRVDASGNPRPLHIRESLECIDFADFEPPILHASSGDQSAPWTQNLIEDPLFTINILHAANSFQVSYPVTHAKVIAAISGHVRVTADAAAVELAAGDFCLVPAALGHISLAGTAGAKILLAEPGPSE